MRICNLSMSSSDDADWIMSTMHCGSFAAFHRLSTMEILFARFNGISFGMPSSCCFFFSEVFSDVFCCNSFVSKTSCTFFRICSSFLSSISSIRVNHVSLVTGNFSQKIFRSVFAAGFFFRSGGGRISCD